MSQFRLIKLRKLVKLKLDLLILGRPAIGHRLYRGLLPPEQLGHFFIANDLFARHDRIIVDLEDHLLFRIVQGGSFSGARRVRRQDR